MARPSGANYLLQTIQSLIDNTNDVDKKDISIVVFLADINESPKSTAKAELTQNFRKYIDEGLLTVIEAYPEFYPPLNNIKEKYGDSDSRRTWRSKENVDATFVMCYCKDLSQYYIHLEDDVISSPSFFPKLQGFIKIQSVKPWLMLDLTSQGSKAKAYQSNDLANIASYFYLMFDEMPIDWLMDYWQKIKDENQGSRRLPPASLFQHIGDQSSLKEKGLSGREQREPFFDQYDQKYRGRNPPAIITSSMSSNQGKPRDAYEKGSGYFWASHQRKGNYVLIKFYAPIAVRKVFVDTGSYEASNSLLHYGVLQASFVSSKGEANTCQRFKTLTEFRGGKAKISLNRFSDRVKCLKILVTEDYSEDIYLREIDVWWDP